MFESQDLGRRAREGRGASPPPPGKSNPGPAVSEFLKEIPPEQSQSDLEFKKKFPQSKKAAKHESVVVGLKN